MNGIGIWLYSSSSNSLRGNTCYLNDEHGIYLVSSDDNAVSANSCTSNDLDGIRVFDSDRNTLVGNNSRSNGWNGTGYGINIENAASDNNVATSNVLFNNDGAGSDSGTGTVKANNYPAF
jgi:parallel beta-helix repeat protein